MIATAALPDDTSITDREKVELMALDAQSSLLPYTLAFFSFSLPIFVWQAAVTKNAIWISVLLLQFSVNWMAFYFTLAWLRRRPDLAVDLAARTRLHIVGGLLWAVAIAQLAAFALGAGQAREPLLLLATGAAVVCMFFTCPSLATLLIVAPVASAPPLIGLYMDPATRGAGAAAWGGIALAMALCLIMNRMLRRQFLMAAERERLVEERARALAEAEQLARSKSDILATLSHEIRNGLNGVNHVLAAATGGLGRAAPSREQMSAALIASNDLLSVLNATLDSENAQCGRLAVNSRPFDVCRLARSLALLARPEAASKSLELTVHVDKELETAAGAATADPVRVRQILTNLISNAVKYTVRGRIELRVQMQGQDRLRIEVADTGPGLNPEELSQAFAPFRRVDRTSMGVSGAGLGLSLSRDLARMMGGQVCADSAQGVGSRFWLELPFDPKGHLAPEPEPEEAQAGRGLRVLVAEGDALNAAMLRSVLEQLGHQVALASDGQRALDLAKVCAFDLLMIDGRTPNMNGAGVIRTLREATDAAAGMPIVAIIDGSCGDAQACTQAGADEVLRIPVSVSVVARALESAANARGAQRARVAVVKDAAA